MDSERGVLVNINNKGFCIDLSSFKSFWTSQWLGTSTREGTYRWEGKEFHCEECPHHMGNMHLVRIRMELELI